MSDVERTLNNLHVLAALSHNDKLNTNDDAFDIYSPTALRGAMRFWHGESRLHNVQRVRHTVRAAVGFASKSLEDANSLLEAAGGDAASASMHFRISTMALEHVRMVEALSGARRGLTNLLQTYRDDAALASQISLLTTEIDDFVSVIRVHSERLRERTVATSVARPHLLT